MLSGMAKATKPERQGLAQAGAPLRAAKRLARLACIDIPGDLGVAQPIPFPSDAEDAAWDGKTRV